MPTSRTRHRLSGPLTACFAGPAVAGLIHGAVTYANRTPDVAEHVAGTAAWWPHAMLAVVAVVLVCGVAVHRRLLGRRGSVLLLPVGRRAADRVRRTCDEARHGRGVWRAIAAIVPTIVLLYGPYRAGIQVIGGLDPSFTANAWGGPGYLGAMACHYLDMALLMAAAAWLLDTVLAPDRARVASMSH